MKMIIIEVTLIKMTIYAIRCKTIKNSVAPQDHPYHQNQQIRTKPKLGRGDDAGRDDDTDDDDDVDDADDNDDDDNKNRILYHAIVFHDRSAATFIGTLDFC